jgi:uncharacterized protein YjiS (DUF1127 family)
MDSIYRLAEWRQAFSLARFGWSLFGSFCAAVLEWKERQGVRDRLEDLSDRELHDIGISRGEIDYVASNWDSDPRGI